MINSILTNRQRFDFKNKKSLKITLKMIKNKSYSSPTLIQKLQMKIQNAILQLIVKKKTNLKLKIATEAKGHNLKSKFRKRFESNEIQKFQTQMMDHKSKIQIQKPLDR